MTKRAAKPEPPSSLGPEARARWLAVLPALERRGAVDLEALEGYCQVWARWRKAEGDLAKSGNLVRGARGAVVANPLIPIARQSGKEVRALEAQLGIGEAEAETPAASGWPIVNRVQLAALIGVHLDTVTEYARLGMPVVDRGGRGKESGYDAVRCLAWWREQRGVNAKEAAQARAANASAELNELKLRRESGALWPKAQIVLAGQSVVKQWATTVRGLPRRLSQQGFITRAQEPAVLALCSELLRQIAGWRPLPDQAPSGAAPAETHQDA